MGIFDKVTEKIQHTRTAIRPKFMSVSDEEIKKYLAAGEDLVATITQAVSTSAKTILLSNERLIVFESGIMKSSFKDYYFRDIKDVKFETSAFSGSTITINADKGNNAGVIVIKDLPLEESKQFYSVLQEIERNWWEKKRKLDLEEKRAVAGGSNISMTAPQGAASPSPGGDDVESKLVKVKSLFDKGLITEEEYKTRKEKLLNEL
jgi:hypothetical protein